MWALTLVGAKEIVEDQGWLRSEDGFGDDMDQGWRFCFRSRLELTLSHLHMVVYTIPYSTPALSHTYYARIRIV